MKQNVWRILPPSVLLWTSFVALDSIVVKILPQDLILWYNQPAKEWVEALPLGNGCMGAMVFGGINTERFQLNEDTLWSGEPRNHNNTNALSILPQVRTLIFEGKYAEAHQLCKKMMGPYNQSYQPMADLLLEFNHSTNVSSYKRWLDITKAVAYTTYYVDGTWYYREAFISAPAQCLVIRISVQGINKLNLGLRLISKHPYTISQDATDMVLNGRVPVHVDPNYYRTKNPIRYSETEGMQFQVRVRPISSDGIIWVENGKLNITNATEVVFLVSSGTSFNGFDKSPSKNGKDPGLIAIKRLQLAYNKSFTQLIQEHITDYKSLFDRVSLWLGESPQDARSLPTDERIRKLGASDPGLVALHFQYGRYLLISSSRPGTQPPNLQGIWNDEIRPPWSANWTLNINAQMNMWPAEVTALPECHEPFFELIRELSITGAETAKIHYGCRGWVAHHNTDIWRQASPVGDYGHGDATWAIWPMAGPWLCHHLWEHFLFTGDTNWLASFAWPIIKEAALFCMDFLIESPEGYLVTCPSTSPENQFITPDGQRAAVAMASTMDISLIREMFNTCIKITQILGIEPELRSQFKNVRSRLYPYKITKDGRLQEWFQDFKEAEPAHRHLSHLWGLFPGSEFTKDKTPELFEAARKSLLARGDEGTGWSTAWKICLWARLEDGEHAYKLIERTLKIAPGGVYPNLFGSHPPFQIDGNFGFTAGIAEMLIQSHETIESEDGTSIRVIKLLPAIPTRWSEGKVKGLKARGGLTIDMKWKDHKLNLVTVHSSSHVNVKLVWKDKSFTFSAKPNQTMVWNP